MVDTRELLSPTWLLFEHALSVNAENRGSPGHSACGPRESRVLTAAIRARSQQRFARSRAWRWNTAVKISSFGGNVQRIAPSHQNWRSWSAERNDWRGRARLRPPAVGSPWCCWWKSACGTWCCLGCLHRGGKDRGGKGSGAGRQATAGLARAGLAVAPSGWLWQGLQLPAGEIS